MLLLTSNSTVLSFEDNSRGQLGDGSIDVHNSSVTVGIPNVIKIAAGLWHSAAITGNG